MEITLLSSSSKGKILEFDQLHFQMKLITWFFPLFHNCAKLCQLIFNVKPNSSSGNEPSFYDKLSFFTYFWIWFANILFRILHLWFFFLVMSLSLGILCCTKIDLRNISSLFYSLKEFICTGCYFLLKYGRNSWQKPSENFVVLFLNASLIFKHISVNILWYAVFKKCFHFT